MFQRLLVEVLGDNHDDLLVFPHSVLCHVLLVSHHSDMSFFKSNSTTFSEVTLAFDDGKEFNDHKIPAVSFRYFVK